MSYNTAKELAPRSPGRSLTAKNRNRKWGGGSVWAQDDGYLSGIECGEEQEEAEGHDENIGLVPRQTQGSQHFASFAVAQLAVNVVEFLSFTSRTKE